MEKTRLGELIVEQKISRIEIVREEKEILLLNELVKCKESKNLIFKGGTALRLVYNGPRFSQDLDFSLLARIDEKNLKRCIESAVGKVAECLLVEFKSKRFTYFSLIKVSSDLLAQNISIKLEISKRPVNWKSERDFIVGTAKSQTANLAVILNVSTLERMFEDKKEAVKKRGKPRDYFDLWYLAQKLDKKLKMPKPKIDKRIFIAELNQFLPGQYRGWAERFLNSYGK